MILTEFHIVKLENPKKRLHHMPFDCLLSTSFYSLFFVKNSITMEGVWRSQSKNPISHVIFPKINPSPPPPIYFSPFEETQFFAYIFYDLLYNGSYICLNSKFNSSQKTILYKSDRINSHRWLIVFQHFLTRIWWVWPDSNMISIIFISTSWNS